jgi:hypothetical protein
LCRDFGHGVVVFSRLYNTRDERCRGYEEKRARSFLSWVACCCLLMYVAVCLLLTPISTFVLFYDICMLTVGNCNL